MSDVVEKVRRLLALAGTPGTGEEEARTAAVQACRLIVAHRLVVVEASAVMHTTAASPAPPVPNDPNDIFQKVRRTMAGEEAQAQAQRPAAPVTELKAVRIYAKKGSVCRMCGAPYLKGTDVYLVKGRHSGVHAKCWTGKPLPAPASSSPKQGSWSWSKPKAKAS